MWGVRTQGVGMWDAGMQAVGMRGLGMQGVGVSWGGSPKGSSPTWEPAFPHTLRGEAKVTAGAACGATGHAGGRWGPDVAPALSRAGSSSSISTGASVVCREPACQRSLGKYLPRLLK